jgi:hypothetical protein
LQVTHDIAVLRVRGRIPRRDPVSLHRLMVQASHPEHIGDLHPNAAIHRQNAPHFGQTHGNVFPRDMLQNAVRKNPIGYVLAKGQITSVRHIGLIEDLSAHSVFRRNFPR